MTCQHCAAQLPPFAMFCGECGRSVSAPAVSPPVVDRPAAPGTGPLPVVPGVFLSPSPARPMPVPQPLPVVSGAAVPVLPAIPDALPWTDDDPLSIDSPDSPASPGSPTLAPPTPCPVCGTEPEPDDLFCAECGTALASDTRIIEPLPQREPPPPADPPSPADSPADPPRAAEAPSVPPPAPEAPAPDIESTRIVAKAVGARFVLQFSTGESYTVLGAGLAGRNPHTEPGEYVDHLVTIVDPGRSVSKTHFEFGQHDGVFWFSDRHSGNGSVIREPGAEPRPCEPGRRYPIPRGTRIDIGEQFVVVS